MNVLLGSIYVGDAKSYCLPIFKAMVEDLFPDIDVLVVTDRDDYHVAGLPTLYTPLQSHWATEICNVGKRLLGQYALDNGYDALVWQGIDCFYDSREDFDRLARLSERYDLVGGLVAGRDMPDYPVCREFVFDGGVTTQERELPETFFEGEGRPLDVYGYIGSDATFIGRCLLNNVDMSGYEEWHVRTQRGDYTLGPDEWFMYRTLKQHLAVPVVHTGVRPWHLHESMSAVRYKGIREQWTSEARPWA